MNKQRIHPIPLIVSLFFLVFAATANPVFATRVAAPASSDNPLGCGINTVSLVSPANNAVLPALYTAFSFESISGITTYVLNVSTQPNFPDPDPAKSERGYEFTIPSSSGGTYTLDNSLPQNFLPDTTYYWRVAPKCQGMVGVYSIVFQFKTPKDGTLLPPPTPDQPANNVKAATNGVTFTWQVVSGAASYQIRFYRYEADANADTSALHKADGTVISIKNEYIYVSDLPFDTILYWRVAAVNNYAVGALSATRKLTIPVKAGTAKITSDGGMITSDGGAITVFVDPGTVLSPTTFHVNLNPHPSTNPPFRFANRAFSVTAIRDSDGSPITQFAPPNELHFRFTYTDEDLMALKLPGGVELELFYYNGSSWQPTSICFIDTALHQIDCEVDHLTEFALGAAERVFIPFLLR